MRRGLVLLMVVTLASVSSMPAAFGQMRSPPGGTTPGGAIFDRLNQSSTRPTPTTPTPTVRAPNETWVPDRYVQVPGTDGQVLVPGHWERRLSDHEVYTPPLTGSATTPLGNGTINFPAGTRPPANERQFP
jgi:hypothetical protein